MKEGLTLEHAFQKEKLILPNIQKKLNEQDVYVCSAIDLITGDNIGQVEVRRQNHNTISIEVNEKYRRHGIARKLIEVAQCDHEDLQLLTSVKDTVVPNLCKSMGFVQVGEEAVFNFYIWKKELVEKGSV